MDFGQLLHVAKKNSEQSKNSAGKYYSTKFSAPKKESKEKALSDNIKKFLVKKEQEEREKARQEKAKLDSLLAKRDEKSKNKIRKMLKVTKSANKSVLDDAVDNQHTSVTIQGPDQPDEDDYGYVSNEAAAFFQKYVDKVGKLPDDKFAPSRPQSKNDLRGTKDRVKAAILREQEEKNSTTRSKTSTLSTTPSSSANSSRISSSSSRKDLYDAEGEVEEKRKREEEQRKMRIKRSGGPAPPILDFKELLKLAEKKQFEPIAIKKVEVEKEPERLLTKREKLEIEQRKAQLEDRQKKVSNAVQKMQPNGKIPKLNSSSVNSGQIAKDLFKKPVIPPKNISSSSSAKSKINSVTNGCQQQNDLKTKSISQQKTISSNSFKAPTTTGSISVSNTGQQQKKVSTIGHSSNNSNKISTTTNVKLNYNGPTREFPPKDIKRVPSQQNIKTREFPPKDLQKTRQFPPSDVRRSRPQIDRKPMKRRIYDDYDEDEYDSDLDDFIEDDPEGERNVSSYIKEIFGYDKSRYRDCEDDIDNMESNFAQQMREETISKKIGLMEDLEDMKKEAEDKKRKNIIKKKKYK